MKLFKHKRKELYESLRFHGNQNFKLDSLQKIAKIIIKWILTYLLFFVLFLYLHVDQSMSANICALIFISAKTNISGMSNYDILRKDYKFIICSSVSNKSIGIPVINAASDVLKERPNFFEDCRAFLKRKDVDFLVVMLLYTVKYKADRYLLIYSPDKNLTKEIDFFVNTHKEEINLENISNVTIKNEDDFLYYKTGTKISRKVILPLFKTF